MFKKIPIEDFFDLPSVSTTRCTLKLIISPQIFEKFETVLMVYSGAGGGGGGLGMEKNGMADGE